MKATYTILAIVLAVVSLRAQKKPVDKFEETTLVIDSTSLFKNAVVYHDSGNTHLVVVKMKLGYGPGVLIPESGTPLAGQALIPFDANLLTRDDVDYIIKEIRFIEAKNKREKK